MPSEGLNIKNSDKLPKYKESLFPYKTTFKHIYVEIF